MTLNPLGSSVSFVIAPGEREERGTMVKRRKIKKELRASKLSCAVSEVLIQHLLSDGLNTSTERREHNTMTITNTPAFTSARKFGVEIEFCTNLSSQEIAEMLCRTGVEVHAEDYNHRTRPHWKIVSDGSVSRGWELVSPVLSGIEGLNEVRKVVNALVQAGATVDTSCGLHVHVDANDLTGASVVNVVRRYSRHEGSIDKVVPHHRRNNQYAGTVAHVVTTVENYLRSNPTATARAICDLTRGERYYKLNVNAFLKHGTVEFRQHSGSIDATKITNWIMFCVTFVEDSIVTVTTRMETPVAPVVAAPPVAAPVPQRPVAVAPTLPVAQRPLRINAVERKFTQMLELFEAAGVYGTVSVLMIANTLNINEASVPSYVSMFRDRYPSVVIRARRNQGYYTITASAVLRNLLNPVRPATTLGDLVRERLGLDQPVAPVAPAPQPARPVTTIEVPTDRGIFDTLPVEVRAYYQERAVDFETSSRY